MNIRVPIVSDQLTFYKTVEEIKHAFDFLPEHVVITDDSGNILYANKAIERTTGYTSEEAIGKNPGDLWGGHMTKEFYKNMWSTIKIQKKPFVGEIENIRKDGTHVWQELHITPVLDEHEYVNFFIAIEPDITDRKNKEQAVAELVRKAEVMLEKKKTH